MTTQPARFSVVIPHRNGWPRLRGCLTALQRTTGPDDEVFVVDNGSSDNSVGSLRAEFPQVRVIANSCNNGFARACNQAMRQASGRYVLLLNNDAGLPENALNQLARDFEENPTAGAIGAQLVGAEGRRQRSHGPLPTPLSECGFRAPQRPLIDANGVAEVEALVGACMALRRAALDQVGLLDERFFFSYEETELCLRLRRAGWRIYLDGRIRSAHGRSESAREFNREARLEFFRSRLQFHRAAFGPGAAAVATSFRIARVIVNLALYGLLTLITLGCFRRSRGKAGENGYLLKWLIAGRPDDWGFPDKCPRANEAEEQPGRRAN